MAYSPLGTDSPSVQRRAAMRASRNLTQSNISRTGSRSYQACHQSFKVVFAGEVDVGKTTLFNQLKRVSDAAEADSASGVKTVPASPGARSTTNLLKTGGRITPAHSQQLQHQQTEFRTSLRLNNGNYAEICFVDTAGEERYNQTLTRSHYKNADLVLFVYDVSDHLSLQSLKHWEQQARAALVGRPGYLIGNKLDLRRTKGHCVAAESAVEFAEIKSLTLVGETSAINGQGVDALYQQITSFFKAPDMQASYRRGPSSSKPESSCCCTLL